MKFLLGLGAALLSAGAVAQVPEAVTFSVTGNSSSSAVGVLTLTPELTMNAGASDPVKNRVLYVGRDGGASGGLKLSDVVSTVPGGLSIEVSTDPVIQNGTPSGPIGGENAYRCEIQQSDGSWSTTPRTFNANADATVRIIANFPNFQSSQFGGRCRVTVRATGAGSFKLSGSSPLNCTGLNGAGTQCQDQANSTQYVCNLSRASFSTLVPACVAGQGLAEATYTVNAAAQPAGPGLDYTPLAPSAINFPFPGPTSAVLNVSVDEDNLGQPGLNASTGLTYQILNATAPNVFSVSGLPSEFTQLSPDLALTVECVRRAIAGTDTATLRLIEDRRPQNVQITSDYALSCAGSGVVPPADAPPNLVYTQSGSRVNIGCPTDNSNCQTGAGAGDPATARILQSSIATTGGLTCNLVNEADVAQSVLNFVPLGPDAGDILCSCPPNPAPQDYSLSFVEQKPVGSNIPRTFTIRCLGSGGALTCGQISGLPVQTLLNNQRNVPVGVPVPSVTIASFTATDLPGGITQSINCTTTVTSGSATFSVSIPPALVLTGGQPTVTGTLTGFCDNSSNLQSVATVACSSTVNIPPPNGCPVLNASYTVTCPGYVAPITPNDNPAGIPTLSPQAKVLLAVALALLGLIGIGARLRQ